jgi:hypothetical protein
MDNKKSRVAAGVVLAALAAAGMAQEARPAGCRPPTRRE